MQRFSDIHSMHETLETWRADNESIALVPTMGNLHEGHLQLVDVARRRADRVVVSIFVNPTQFGPNEDFAHYPRTEDHDCAVLLKRGVDAVFLPSIEVLYGDAAEADMHVPTELAGKLCGLDRPGHFDGVATVVRKLFEAVQPDFAVFGEKDYQQLLVIRWLVAELELPVEVIGVPTVREADGLAMSSRNQYLSAAERELAPMLYKALRAIAKALRLGNRDFAGLARQATAKLSAAGWQVDYIEILRPDLQLAQASGSDFVILAAARLGKTRLIDNLECRILA